MTTAAMKKLNLLLGVGLASLTAGCLERSGGQPGSQFGALIRWHYAGSAALAREADAAKLRQVLALPTSVEVRGVALDKLARAPHRFWITSLPAGTTDQAPLIRPLLDDLVASESFLEVRGTTARPETVLAVQLNDARARLWETNLWQLAQNWKLGTPRALAAEGGRGWEVKRQAAPNLLQFVRAGQWVLVGLGHDQLALLPAMLQQTARSGRPGAALTGAFLDLQADWPALRSWFPIFAEYQLPPTHLTWSCRGDAVRTEGKFFFSEKLPWTPEPWKIPVNSIRDPIINFTVARGIAPLLAQTKGVSELGLKTLPNQFCAWANSYMFAQTFFTFPVTDATNTIRQLSRTVPKFMQHYATLKAGKLAYVSNRAELLWHGVPVANPHLRPLRDGRSEFLLAALFPLAVTTNAPPPEQLFKQFQGRDNLAYYDWEFTQERIIHARPMYQLTDIILKRQFTPTNAPSQRWIQEIAPHLGNTITEITVAGPKELALVRKSCLGFTGFELYTFTRWLESPGFPLKFEPPPPAADPRSKQPARLPVPGNTPKR
jgi:hypothetical protein